jgi:hypothetical protein
VCINSPLADDQDVRNLWIAQPVRNELSNFVFARRQWSSVQPRCVVVVARARHEVEQRAQAAVERLFQVSMHLAEVRLSRICRLRIHAHRETRLEAPLADAF